jgi:hypothetical protein
VLRYPDAFSVYHRPGLFEHFAGAIMKNPETDILHDVKGSPLNFPNLIIT